MEISVSNKVIVPLACPPLTSIFESLSNLKISLAAAASSQLEYDLFPTVYVVLPSLSVFTLICPVNTCNK